MGNIALVCVLSLTLLAFARTQGFSTRTFSVLWLGLISKICFCGLAAYFFLAQLIYKDADRYYSEIIGIAQDPTCWNAFFARGPWAYEVSNKMGMSYLYGATAYLFGASPLLSVFALNIFLSTMTAILGVLLAREFCGHRRYDAWVLLALSFHPEIFFWSNRVLRENLSIFLVTATVYLCTRLFKKDFLSAGLGLAACLAMTYLTRAQLTLIFPLFCIATLAVMSLQNFGKHLRAFGMLALVLSLLLVNQEFLSWGIRSLRILPAEIANFLALSPEQILHECFRLIDVLPRVLSFAPAAFGRMGVFLIPFSAIMFCGALLSVLHQIFGARLNFRYSNAILITALVFYLGLAVMDLYTDVPFGVRFRTPLTPLLLTIAVPSVLLLIEDLRSTLVSKNPA